MNQSLQRWHSRLLRWDSGLRGDRSGNSETPETPETPETVCGNDAG
ncbi:hypothetical protein [Microcoleus sp. Z1_B5]